MILIMPGPEKKIEQRIIRELRRAGYFVLKVHGSDAQMSGIPDLLVCAEGRFVGIEVKTPDTISDVSPIQALRIDQIRDAGGVAGAASSLDDALALIAEALKE